MHYSSFQTENSLKYVLIIANHSSNELNFGK